MKYILLGVSVICLSFTFAKNFDLTEDNIPQPIHTTTGDSDMPAGKAAGVSDVVTKALAFRALLSSAQQATLEKTYTTALARKWSNLPCGSGCRNGIQFSTLSAAQLEAALDVIKAAAGTATDEGYAEFNQIRLAEIALKNAGGNGYDSGIYFISFLNTPTPTGAWMLQFGGHHYAANISFNNGHVIGATPRFEGVEPTSYTFGGTTYAPLSGEHDAMTAMLASLTSGQLASAKLTQTFSDVTLAPGESNGGSGTFPATKAGVSAGTFTAAQKALVTAAMQHWVQDMDDATAAAIMAVYTSELDNTYIAYTGNGTSGSAGTFLNANTNYVRIDGPTVWIEFVCQSGVVFPSQIHYHTVWRDHAHDYGVDLTGASIDGSGSNVGIANTVAATPVTIYPNPATSRISFTLPAAVTNADVILTSAVSGQTVTISSARTGTTFDYDVSRLPAGMYILRITDGAVMYSGKFNKL